jgi:penicillin-binding protein 2
LASTTTRRSPSRRFLPRDAGAVEPYRLTPKLALRIAVLGGVVALVFGALFLRLWALQVLAGTKYVDQVRAISTRTLPIQAPRGVILDRNGNILVSNVDSTAVELWPADLPKNYVDRYDELRRIARVTRVPLYEIAAAIKRHQGDPVTPVVIRDGVKEPLVNYLAEHTAQFPGVEMGPSYIRSYPYGALAAQVLGYNGEISSAQLKTMAKKGYHAGDEIGQAGVESAYDTYLRGVAGTAKLNVDSLNRPRGELEVTTLSKPGHAVRLTLDVKLQAAAEKALQYGIHLAQADGQWAARGGAIVAMDPNDGSILALASSPTYNPSVYSGRVTTKALNAQGLTAKTALDKNFPSLDRALQGTYPPGSVFKPVTALAAMESHILSPYSTLPCTGTYTAPEDKSHRTWHNWDPNVNQAMNLPTALAYSCDTYFYQLGNDFYSLPADRGQPLQKWASLFGFGAASGTDAGPESDGLVPTIGWLQHHFTAKTDPTNWRIDRIWKPGNSIQLAIGQGDLLVTPLQMARFYALIANGGKLVTPHVLMDVENPNGTAVPVPAIPAPRNVGVDPAALQVVQQGLYEGTHMPFGTSYAVFGNFPVAIAGKTGTAEKVVSLPGYLGVQNQSWWCGYGPSDAAKLVVCAVIENGGHGGTAAAPAAAQVFAQFFHKKIKQVGPIHSD